MEKVILLFYRCVGLFFTLIKRPWRSLPFLLFLTGICLAACCYFITEAKYEAKLFRAISKNIQNDLPQNYSAKEFALKAMNASYRFLERRSEVFKGSEFAETKASFFRPLTIDLMTGDGACGSYAIVLARILKENNIPVRIGQMKVNGRYGGHIFTEAKTEDGWVVLDPFYNLAFRNENGSLAGFKQLNMNWSFYKMQVPIAYNQNYTYHDVRYTNWGKIPFLTTGIKAILNVVLGKQKADQISVRPYMMKTYHYLSWISSFILVLLFFQTGRLYKRKLKMQRMHVNRLPINEKLNYTAA